MSVKRHSAKHRLDEAPGVLLRSQNQAPLLHSACTFAPALRCLGLSFRLPFRRSANNPQLPTENLWTEGFCPAPGVHLFGLHKLQAPRFQLHLSTVHANLFCSCQQNQVPPSFRADACAAGSPHIFLLLTPQTGPLALCHSGFRVSLTLRLFAFGVAWCSSMLCFSCPLSSYPSTGVKGRRTQGTSEKQKIAAWKNTGSHQPGTRNLGIIGRRIRHADTTRTTGL